MKLTFNYPLSFVGIFAMILFSSAIQAQILGIYEFSGSGVCPQTNVHVTSQPANAVFSTYASVNTTCTASTDVFNNKAWNTGVNVDLAEYNEFRIIPGSCFRLNLVLLKFEHKLSTGTANWHVRTNLDHFAADLFTGTSSSAQTTASLNLPVIFASADTLVFRFYITGIASGTTTWRQDNVSVSGTVYSISPVMYYTDHDGDGFGAGTGVELCSNPGGYVLIDGDCDDNDFNVNPNSVWYADLDEDGFGDPEFSETGCTSTLTNATLQGGDCNDDNDLIHPETIWYEDADEDGFGDGGLSQTGCESAFVNPILVSGDCNDNEPTVYPGAPEICDEFDNNCNGQVNEGLTFSNYYKDNDHDGFGAGTVVSFCNDPGNDYVSVNGDCDDDNASVYPGATEILGNGVDENCDGTDGYLGLASLNSAHFKLFPNPGKDFVTVNFSATLGRLSLYALSGQLIWSLDVKGEEKLQINTQILDPGMYLIELETGSGKEILRWMKE